MPPSFRVRTLPSPSYPWTPVHFLVPGGKVKVLVSNRQCMSRRPRHRTRFWVLITNTLPGAGEQCQVYRKQQSCSSACCQQQLGRGSVWLLDKPELHKCQKFFQTLSCSWKNNRFTNERGIIREVTVVVQANRGHGDCCTKPFQQISDLHTPQCLYGLTVMISPTA